MVACRIELDEEVSEQYAEHAELSPRDTVSSIRDRAEADLREGRFVTWADVRKRNLL